jgi:ferric-dicitrate binding protein FerR (iron transport regulator)
MFRFCAISLSAGLLFASSFGAQASSVEAEWILSASVEMTASVEVPASAETAWVASLEEQACDLATQVEAFASGEEAVLGALAPEKFLDAHEAETAALITADLALAAETTGSIDPSVVLDAAMAAGPGEPDAVRLPDEADDDLSTPLP